MNQLIELREKETLPKKAKVKTISAKEKVIQYMLDQRDRDAFAFLKNHLVKAIGGRRTNAFRAIKELETEGKLVCFDRYYYLASWVVR